MSFFQFNRIIKPINMAAFIGLSLTFSVKVLANEVGDQNQGMNVRVVTDDDSEQTIAKDLADGQLTNEQETNEAKRLADTLWHTLLPSKIFDGYWAATEMIGGMAVVVEYEPDGSVTLHEYDCNRPYHPNVSVKSDFDIRMRLIPTEDDNVHNVYSYSRQRISSQIQNIKIIGNMLDMEQVFVRKRPTETVPYTYKYSETLTPICNHDKRKKS